MYYVVSFEGRCMGFCPTEGKAQDLVAVFGGDSRFEQVHETFPSDEAAAARAWERKQPVRSIVAAPEVTTAEISPEELAELKELLSADETPVFEGLEEDPWPESENTQIRSGIAGPGESGFFLPAQVG